MDCAMVVFREGKRVKVFWRLDIVVFCHGHDFELLDGDMRDSQESPLYLFLLQVLKHRL